jgi:hypothetical protein
MRGDCQISIFDLGLCFKKLKKISPVDNLYFHVEHPSLSNVNLEFMSSVDYGSGKNIWRLNDNIDIVSDYE